MTANIDDGYSIISNNRHGEIMAVLWKNTF